jgi:hypothetical protein
MPGGIWLQNYIKCTCLFRELRLKRKEGSENIPGRGNRQSNLYRKGRF